MYDGDTLQNIRNYTLPEGLREGWGLTKGREVINGAERDIFYFSDGSHKIFKINPDDFSIIDKIEVCPSITAHLLNWREDI